MLPYNYEETVAALRKICQHAERARITAQALRDQDPQDQGYQFLYTTLVENERKAEDAYVRYVTKHTMEVEGI